MTRFDNMSIASSDESMLAKCNFHLSLTVDRKGGKA